jgi:hypothetical protein
LEVGVSDLRVDYLISIGTPINKYEFSFLEDCRKPILFVHGEHDEFGNVEELKELVKALGQNTSVELVIIPGAGHFFEGHLDELQTAITEWINKRLST